MREPRLALFVAKHDDVLAALEDDVEVAAADRLVGPPAVDDAPFLPHQRNTSSIYSQRRRVDSYLDERRPRLVQPSRRALARKILIGAPARTILIGALARKILIGVGARELRVGRRDAPF